MHIMKLKQKLLAGWLLMKILEKDVEAALVKRVKALGGTAEKFTSPSLCLSLRKIELKAPGKRNKTSPDHDRRALGAFVINTVEAANFQ